MKKSFEMSKRERILVGVGIIGIFVLTYVLGYQKQLKQIVLLQGQISEQQQDLDKKRTVIKELEGQNESLKILLATKSQASRYLESSNYLAELLRQLGASDKRDRQLDLKSIDIKETTKVSKLARSTFELEIESSFIDLGRYLASLEKSDHLIEVRSVKMSRIDNDLKRCNATIEVQGYHNEEPGQ